MAAGSNRYLFAVPLCLLLASSVRADTLVSARVSDVHGRLAVHGPDESAPSYVERNSVVRAGDTLWTDQKGPAEIELERGSCLRVADDTKIEIHRLDGRPEFRLWNGAAYFQARRDLPGPAVFHTPDGDVEVNPGSIARVDLSQGNGCRVTIYEGAGRFLALGVPPVVIPAGDRIYTESGHLAGAPTVFNRGDVDTFDKYELSRVDYLAHHASTAHLTQYVAGADELDGAGIWVNNHGVDYWHPRYRPGWRPYSTGYWSYDPRDGYEWVDREPWGYTTSHYGRWAYLPEDGGWCWRPTYVYAPAPVAWVRYGDYYGWAPLDYYSHPCVGPGLSVGLSLNFGGVSIGLDYRSWSFCPHDTFFYGRAAYFDRPRYYGINEVHINRTNITRVNVVNNVYSGFGVPAHAVRGLTVGRDGYLARNTVLASERRISPQRRALAASRFGVAGNRGLALARAGSPVEQFQRNRSARLPANASIAGAAGAARFRRTALAAGGAGAAVAGARALAAHGRGAAANRPGGLPNRPGAVAGNRDQAFRRGQASAANKAAAAHRAAAGVAAVGAAHAAHAAANGHAARAAANAQHAARLAANGHRANAGANGRAVRTAATGHAARLAAKTHAARVAANAHPGHPSAGRNGHVAAGSHARNPGAAHRVQQAGGGQGGRHARVPVRGSGNQGSGGRSHERAVGGSFGGGGHRGGGGGRQFGGGGSRQFGGGAGERRGGSGGERRAGGGGGERRGGGGERGGGHRGGGGGGHRGGGGGRDRRR